MALVGRSFLISDRILSPITILAQEIREDLMEFERQVEEDTATAMKQAKSTGTDKKREKELMRLVLAATA
jgi:hypothetical protein